jgi:hypothetical protein
VRTDSRLHGSQPYITEILYWRKSTMPENVTTDHTNNRPIGLDLDRDDWESALKPYEGDPHAALLLGFNLAVLRTNLDSQLIKCRPVMEALDHGMEALFPYTTFHNASFDLFLRYVDGKLTFEEEQMLSALGINRSDLAADLFVAGSEREGRFVGPFVMR